MLPVVGGLFDPVLTELLVAGDVIHALVIGQHADHLVVDLAAIIEFHDADDAGLHQGAGHQGLGDANDLHIKRIAVFIPGAGQAAVGKGISQGGVTNPVQLQVAGFGDQLVLIDGHGVQLHDHVQTQLIGVGESRQHVQQVQHRAAGRVIDIGHRMEREAPGSYRPFRRELRKELRLNPGSPW